MTSPPPPAIAPLLAPAADAAEPSPPTPSTSSAPISTTLPPTDPPTVPLSKTQQKRQAKQALFDAAKPLRRAREKAHKKEKIAEKRKLIELGVLERPVSKRQNGNRPRRPFGARIVVDMGFDEKMTDKEIKSMGSQLGFCYAANRSSPTPVPFLVTSLNGRLKHRMDTVTHKAHESWREVEWWEEGYEELWADEVAGGEGTMVEGGEEKDVALVDLGTLKGKPRARTRREDVVYLTGDSPNVLTSLEEGKTYILGGIVDRNRYKLLCYDKATSSGIQHAQLPISEFLPEMTTRKILTVNQVFEIMLQWVEKRDWKEALQTVMPTRKFVDGPRVRGGRKWKDGEGEGEDGEEEGGERDESMELNPEKEEGEAEAGPSDAKPSAE